MELLKWYINIRLLQHKFDMTAAVLITVTEVRECLVSFGVESFVFQFATQKCKD